ncbi:RNA-binding protein PNO1 (PNO1) [Vairimorpha necatrix]|uniref:Pre-rRNA-processing protein PNO1 n=1 Tax=Vairimorpha necatrix TaxID=6039 RepID=A0AAX4J8J3_9MICR
MEIVKNVSDSKNTVEIQGRSIDVPNYRMMFYKTEWLKIYTPIVELAKIQIRMNFIKKQIDIRTCDLTEDTSFLNRTEQFLKAINLGFSIEDSLSILKFADVFLDNFNIHEVKILKNLHIERAIGRMIGRDGKTKTTIESLSRCKSLIKDANIFLLGPIENTRIAKDSYCRLIMGSQPGTIYNRLRNIRTKIKDTCGSIQTIYNELEKKQ